MSRSPRYCMSVEYTSKDGYHSSFEAEEETQQDAFLLAAKMIGYYQRGENSIDAVFVKENKTGQYVVLPKGLRGLYF